MNSRILEHEGILVGMSENIVGRSGFTAKTRSESRLQVRDRQKTSPSHARIMRSMSSFGNEPKWFCPFAEGLLGP